jgi:hypothetical protein
MEIKSIINCCRQLIRAFENGDLGQTEMPENSHPEFYCQEECLAYFTLPMALNYQRNSYELWKSALKTYQDVATRDVFDLSKVIKMSEGELRGKLTKYKVALQPNKHVATWATLSNTIFENWGSIDGLLKVADSDFLKLREIFQKDYKKNFPYLSGPKIFNYWCYILTLYCGVKLKNAQCIDIAPDTHITKCSVRLGVITEEQAETLTKEEISSIWRNLLAGSGINPIEMHAPLWFWSRNGFSFDLKG